MRKTMFLICSGLGLLSLWLGSGTRCWADFEESPYSLSGGDPFRLIHVATLLPAVRLDWRAPTGRPTVVPASLDINSVDEGRSQIVPWSGDWWKARDGGMIRTLRKLDLLTGKQAAAWEERAKNPRTACEWAGYCHAWAAASVLEREPRAPRTVTGPNGKSVTLSVGDQKAWLTICHDDDKSDHVGERFTGGATDDPQDIAPDKLWRSLRSYVKQRGVPLILDIDPGTAVWNHPVYRYRVTHYPHTTDGLRLGTMELWMADDKVHADFVGTKVKKKTYQFTFRMKGNALVMGSGRWYGPSVKDHPDFAWYPTTVRPKNPHVNVAMVRRMVGSQTPAWTTGTAALAR